MALAEPTEIGARAEAAVASALIRVGMLVFLPALDMNSRVDLVYLMPAAGLPTRCCSLRLAPARNGQEKRVGWAHDFLLGPP